MRLQDLRTKLEDVSDYMVEAENRITHVGDHPVFTELHLLLNLQLDLVVDLINDE